MRDNTMTTLVLSADARYVQFWHRGVKIKDFYIYDTIQSTYRRARQYAREYLGTDPITQR